MLTCQELIELVTEYAEGRLPWSRYLAFQMHLGMCRHCRAYVKQVRLTVRIVGQVPAQPMPQDVEDELLRRFRTWQPSGTRE